MTVNISPYLMMDGNANEAIEFYKQALDAEVIAHVLYEEMLNPPSEDLKKQVAHAKLKVEEAEFMLSDSPSTSPIKQGNQVTIYISTNDIEKSKRYFDALVQGGKPKMPFQKTPFSSGYGSLTDKFGVTFLLDTEEDS